MMMPGRVMRVAVLAAVIVAATLAPAAAKPRRIVSLNLCADQLIMLLADRRAIASVTYLAADPEISFMADEARGLPVNYGLAEEVLALDADLVIAGVVTTRPTVALLRKFGIPVLEMGIPDSLDAVRRQIRLIAEAVGETARGEAVIAAMDARIRAARSTGNGRRPTAAVYRADGFTVGTRTLVDDILHAAGLDNLGKRLGIAGAAHLPLESLITAGPDIIVFGNVTVDRPSIAHMLLRHPALRAAVSGVGGTRTSLTVPTRLWDCGGPFNAIAVERLAAARARVLAGGARQ